MSYQQQLKTYIDRNKLTINYEEKETNNKLFLSRVIINGKEYEWSLEQQNKKTAKQEAAKIALNQLNITEESLSNEESIRDILLDIRELLKSGLDKY
jgi:dsRNA-specific ribonuclease|tara:strand:+ start:162 stop:452 length:291 start_codon:yes stop_codon:yes gene_type:complete